METVDDLRLGGLKIIQNKDGYRFSLDPVLLCHFGHVAAGEAVADLGTGSGIVPLILARTTAARHIVGIEIQSELAERAQRSVRLNGLAAQIEILQHDLRQRSVRLPPQTFDVVLTNPPYRALGRGRQAPNRERAAARHELAGGLEDFLTAASWLLKEGGRFYVVYLAERLVDLLAAMRQRRLEPKRLRCVHSRQDQGARMVLVEGRKGGRSGLKIEAPLVVFAGSGYSAEVLAIYGEGGGAEGETEVVQASD